MCSIDKLFIELGWESLQTRINKHKLVTFYKIMHGLAPNYLSDLLPPIVGQTNNYALSNAGHIRSFRSKTNLFADSFFPSTIKAWNSLPNEAKGLPSVLAFKNYLKRNKLQSPYYFHVGSRFGQILLTRLTANVMCKNIVESPSCQHCGGFESAYHIFFTCPLYAATRRHLPANLHEYSLKDLLYGTENGTSHENETLFLKVQDFLTKCGRFNPQ